MVSATPMNDNKRPPTKGHEMKLNLEGKSVLITGASKGIGLAAARAFAVEGCSRHLAARSVELLDVAKKSIAAEFAVPVQVHTMDLSNDAQMCALAAKTGTVDILINNAGDIPGGPMDAVTDAVLRTGFDIKVFGCISLTRAL